MRNRLTRVHLGHQPRLETLEDRLPPGDAVLGMLLSMAALPGYVDAAIETGHATKSFSILHVNDLDVLDLTNRPSASVLTRASQETTRRSTDRMDAVDTLRVPDAARPTSIPSFRPPSAGRTFGTTALSVVGTPSGAKPSVAAIPGDSLESQPLSPNVSTTLVANHDIDKSLVVAPDHYGNPPLTFEANHGQTESQVDFIARTGGATVFLTPTAAVFSISSESASGVFPSSGLPVTNTPHSLGVALHMQIVGANPAAIPVGQDRQPGIVNYFIGNDPSRWRTDIPTFGRVQYQDVYPGIDLAYYGNNGQMEYDFIVSPGADPNAITINFAGADSVDLNAQGDLVLHTAAGDVVQQKPFTYQEAGATRQEVASRYVVDGTLVRFEVGAYDATRELVIDPLVMGYSTYLGGSKADEVYEVATDSAGNVYIAGSTDSPDYPTTPGTFDNSLTGGVRDAFVTKLNSAGTAAVYSTYLGSNGDDRTNGLAVHGAGEAYVTGQTSGGFPVTSGAFDTTYNGGTDMFVAKLNVDGNALGYATYLGGVSFDGVEHYGGIAVDAVGRAYVTGWTYSPDFPTTSGAFDTTYAGGILDSYVVKLNAAGSALAYSTFLGGSVNDQSFGIAVDGAGNVYVTGDTNSADFPVTPGAFQTTLGGGICFNKPCFDVFVAKLNPTGSALVYATFVGGSHDDYSHGIAVDGSENAYVAGISASTDFPTTPGAFDTTHAGNCGEGCMDIIAVKVNATGSALTYSTFLGSEGIDVGSAIAVNAAGNAYVTGTTRSHDFPTTPGAFDTSYNGEADPYMTKLNASGSALVYSTFLGGSAIDGARSLALDRADGVYIAGVTDSIDYPVTPGAFDTTPNGGRDGFVTKFCERACRVPTNAVPVVP